MWQLPPLKPEEIVIYSRKSRADDPLLTVEEVLEKHEQMLNDWVSRNLPGAGPIPEENRYREVVSGETIDSRPQVKAMFRHVESPRIKAVLIVEPQRLSRGDLEDIGRTVKLLRYSNTIVITLPYTYDLRDDRDRDMFERELKRGNEFLEYQKRIQQNGRLLSVQNGNYVGNKPPYGYRKIQIKDGKKKCFTLEPHPEQAPIVKLIFEMYAAGESSHKIARTLNEMGVKAQNGGRWGPESLSRVRRNEHYIGKVVWNRRKQVKYIEDGEVITRRPMQEEYLIYPGKHEPIIDQELWDKVQEIRGKIPPVKGKVRCANPFAGLIFCQKCGRALSRQSYGKGEKQRAPARLICPLQNECHTASCTVDEMIEEVVKILKGAIVDFTVRVERDEGSIAAVHASIIEQHEKRLEELDALEISQWDKYTQEGMPKHIFEALNAKVLAEKTEIQQALCTARESMPEKIDYEKKISLFSDAIAALEDPDVPALEKNLLLKQCIDYIEYNRKRKPNNNRRYGNPEALELDVYLRV